MIAPLFGFVVAILAPSGANPPADHYAIGAIKADFKVSRRIGARRAGLVCLPAGSFRWSEARPALADASAAVATALHDQAPAMFDSADDPFNDERTATRFKLVATIEDFTLNACVRNWGLARRVRGGGGLTGRMHISVTWDVFDRVTRSKVANETVATDMDVAPGTSDVPEVLLAALKQNAAKFAREHVQVSTAR